MAPTPLTAPYRLTLQYTVGGLVHKAHYYLRCVASADPSGFNTVPRSGFIAAGVSTLGDWIFGSLKPFYKSTDTTFDNVVLEANVGGAWVYVWSASATVTPTGTAPYKAAAMVTYSGKDTAGKNFPVFFYEMDILLPKKNSSVAAMDANSQALANTFFNTAGTAIEFDPVAWRVSRGGFFSQRWLAQVSDTNEKLRRVRGIK